jgi:hypothetical protein
MYFEGELFAAWSCTNKLIRIVKVLLDLLLMICSTQTGSIASLDAGGEYDNESLMKREG